jgi:hypothetical protein
MKPIPSQWKEYFSVNITPKYFQPIW